MAFSLTELKINYIFDIYILSYNINSIRYLFSETQFWMECQFRVHPLELLIIVDCCTHFNTRIINIVLDCGDERISNLQFKKNINFCDFFLLLQNTEAMSELREYVLCLLIILLLLIPSIFFKKQNYPPSPLALPIIGHLHLLTHAPHQALATAP